MNLLAVVTPPSIYHGCSTRKTLWAEKFTGKQGLNELFLAVNMKNCGRRNVRKHRYHKDSDKYITLNILLNFDSLNKFHITPSESKDMERSGNGFITFLGFKTKSRSQKYKTARYAIGNISKKHLSKLNKDFEKVKKLAYESKRLKHEPTDS